MPLVYITGPPGSGKSTIERALRANGHKTYDIDDSKLGGAYNKTTGKRAAIPSAAQRTPDWFEQHEWRVDTAEIGRLKKESEQRDIFVCGVTPNDEPILPYFDEIFYLDIDENTLKERIKNRQGNDYGKNDFEMADILERKVSMDKLYESKKMRRIDVSKSVEQIVKTILSEL